MRKPGIFILLLVYVFGSNSEASLIFPEDFLFGVSTSAYQIEGAWNVGGKSENIWDDFTHKHPNKIYDGSNGDMSCDSYHKLEEDVALMKSLGVNFYRFSLSWTRILPSPIGNTVNIEGIAYYNKLIDLLLVNDIQPMITLYHWDFPLLLQKLGGFTNYLIIEQFVNYAKVAFENFGDRVKLWATFNQPYSICIYGYEDDVLPPAVNLSGIMDYVCAHNILKAHAAVYHLYSDNFRHEQKGGGLVWLLVIFPSKTRAVLLSYLWYFLGRVSITLSSYWYEPDSNAKEDTEAAEKALQFELGLYAHPIFSTFGDYPNIVKESVANRSKAEGFQRSRLPQLTKEEIEYIKGSYDFFSVNHYSTFLATSKTPDPIGEPSYIKDMNVNTFQNQSWPGSPNPHHKHYLKALLEAIHKEKVLVKAYSVWSLLDNFEWTGGYIIKYGLFEVDFLDSNRARTPKASARYYQEAIATKRP